MTVQWSKTGGAARLVRINEATAGAPNVVRENTPLTIPHDRLIVSACPGGGIPYEGVYRYIFTGYFHYSTDEDVEPFDKYNHIDYWYFRNGTLVTDTPTGMPFILLCY